MNENQGVLAIALFAVTLILGWISGLFRTLRHRPKFRIEVIEGPTLCCVLETGRKYDGRPTHRTAISLYLKIANVGSAPSSMPLIGSNWLWLRKGLLRHWINDTHAVLSDFRVNIGSSVKLYPFLFQRSIFTGNADTYLEVGKQVVGVVYFEDQEAWGSYRPQSANMKIRKKIALTDAFGGRHTTKAIIPLVSVQEARRFCADFGQSLESLRDSKDSSQ